MANKRSKATDEKQQKQNQQADTHAQKAADSKAIAADTQSEPDLNQALDALLETLEGDLTEIDTDGALGIIDEWYNFLHKAKQPELKELASGLKELQKLLKSGKATGHEIGEVLVQIGEQTGNFASEADKALKTPLSKLGKQLSQAGTSIGKAEDQEHVEEINSLVEAIEGEDLTSMDGDRAVGTIDEWYNLLHKSEDEKFQEIANGLKELKQILKRSNAKPAAIAEVLSRLGEQTSEVASEAPRGFKTVIQKLGKGLSKAGKDLESAE